eukprot:4166827-Pleurochrysis_carterae.AAC.1
MSNAASLVVDVHDAKSACYQMRCEVSIALDATAQVDDEWLSRCIEKVGCNDGGRLAPPL